MRGADVVAQNREALPTIIDTLIAAARAGELDAQLGLAVQSTTQRRREDSSRSVGRALAASSLKSG